MRIYEPTAIGEKLAVHTGLERLATRIQQLDSLDPLLYTLVEDRYNHWDNTEEIEDTAIAEGFTKLSTYEDRRNYVKGLQIEPGKDTWRHVGGVDNNALIPSHEMPDFCPADRIDRFIVSGLVGLSLANYRSQYSILAKSRFAEYGFQNYSEACGFVGAYVVGKLCSVSTERIRAQEPTFSFDQDGIKHTVALGGSFHGDFMIRQSQSIRGVAVTPTGLMTAYGPRNELDVAGYHSVEPSITVAMITTEYMQNGTEGAVKLLADFAEVAHSLQEPGGSIGYTVGNFGDYGDGESHAALMPLRLLLKDDDYKERRQSATLLHSSPYLPQSQTMFEIVKTDEGLAFQNRDRDAYAGNNIAISRSHFPALFKSLLIQAQAGLGRTSPHQHVEVIKEASKLLI